MELLWHLLVPIKSLNRAEEEGELLMVVHIVIEFLESSNQVAERLHQEGCNGHTKEQDECTDQPLFVGSWGEVPESYGGQRSKEEVSHCDGLIQDRFLFYVIVV